jgi:SAM-dependent methyltransferase
MSDWDDLADWWVDAVRDDPTQSADTLDLLSELVEGTTGRCLDLGCGEGQAMRLLTGPTPRPTPGPKPGPTPGSSAGTVVGTDLSHELLTRAASAGPVVRACLPDLSWVRPGSFERAVGVGIVDMIGDHAGLFANVARAVRSGGSLIVVMNHPVATAPGSEPLSDPDGEILWRWGTYLVDGSTAQEAGDRTVDLVHRPLGHLLTTAADAGWSLEQMIERGPSAAAIEQIPGFRGQAHIPNMLGLRWRLT